MKTLDEVIKAWSICFSENSRSDCTGCPYADEDGEAACFNHDREDALHYLKELRHILDNTVWVGSTKEENGYWKLPTLPETGNDPLTWQELQQMVDKPVWVDAESLPVGVSTHWKDWYIIKSFSNDEFMYCNDGFEWGKEMQGRLWQAYRKERE